MKFLKSKVAKHATMAGLTFMLAAEPALANTLNATPITDLLQALINLLTGIVAKMIGILALIVAGFMTMAGRIEPKQFLMVIGGLALVFGAPIILNGFAAGTGTAVTAGASGV